jgi:hypothetical protein
MARRSTPRPAAPQSSLLSDNEAPQPALRESPAPAEQPLTLVEDPPNREPGPLVEVARDNTPMTILLRAIQDPTLDMVKLERFMALQERWAAEEARKAYVRAMAVFKGKKLRVVKSKTAKVEKNGAVVYTYQYATLASITEIVIPALAECGFSHAWSSKQDHKEGIIHIACKLTHAEGHSEQVELTAGYDTSGGKNSIQTIASAQTYLQRYTLLATGLATSDEEDDDGAAAGLENPGLQPISAEQLQTIKDKLETMEGTATKGLLDYLKVPSLEEIPIQAYELAIDALDRRKKLRG